MHGSGEKLKYPEFSSIQEASQEYKATVMWGKPGHVENHIRIKTFFA